jgi:hypothetical protein
MGYLLNAIQTGMMIAMFAIGWGIMIELLTQNERLGALAFWGTALLWLIWFLTNELKKKKRGER